MRTSTKILLCVVAVLAAFNLGRCEPATMVGPVYAKAQPPARTPLPQYQPGLDSAVWVEMESGHCTGVILNDNRHLLTATHCVEGNNPVAYTTTHKGERIANHGRIVANDGADHVLLLMDKPLIGRPAKIAKTPPPGSMIYMWGNPSDYNFLLRVGYVAGSFVGDDGTYYDVMAIDIWHGDSGGAMFDAQGNVVNVNHAYLNDYNPFSRATFKMAIVQPFQKPFVQ